MATKPAGLLSIMAEEDDSESEDSEPASAEARALKAMHAAMQAGNWEDAASEFKVAYRACAMGEDEDVPEDEDEY